MPLTPRERQVAALVASGRTNRQIGRVLGISEKTAEVHLHHVMSKLDVRSRAEVAAWAVTHHLSAQRDSAGPAGAGPHGYLMAFPNSRSPSSRRTTIGASHAVGGGETDARTTTR